MWTKDRKLCSENGKKKTNAGNVSKHFLHVQRYFLTDSRQLTYFEPH